MAASGLGAISDKLGILVGDDRLYRESGALTRRFDWLCSNQKRALVIHIPAVAKEVALGKMSVGGAAKQLRENLLAVSQERFAIACKISKRTLSQLEVDSGNPALATLDAIFKKFGLKISLAHRSPIELNASAAKKSKAEFIIPTVAAALAPLPSPREPI